jgi:hypothetical protein
MTSLRPESVSLPIQNPAAAPSTMNQTMAMTMATTTKTMRMMTAPPRR